MAKRNKRECASGDQRPENKCKSDIFWMSINSLKPVEASWLEIGHFLAALQALSCPALSLAAQDEAPA
jgi:hypothetical protein